MYKLEVPGFLTESADDIHKRMIENAPPGINTIEGDLLWDATRPCAEVSARIKNISLVYMLNSRFPQTATGIDLDYCGDENGVPRKKEDFSIQKIKVVGSPETVIEKDRIVCTQATEERASIEFILLETVTIGENGEITVNARCLENGTIGNVSIGEISILAKSLNGISSVSNVETVKFGVDIESDDDYRERIIQKAQTPATSGNKYHYLNWALEVPGVGAAKVFPLANGPGTVKIVIVDSKKHLATQELVKEVSEYIEEVRPIGATVSVVSAAEKDINVTVNVSLVQGYNLGIAQQEFRKLLEEYLQSISFKTDYISIAKMGNLILSTSGVLDYTELRINNLSSNISLADEEIAVLGTVELSGVI